MPREGQNINESWKVKLCKYLKDYDKVKKYGTCKKCDAKVEWKNESLRKHKRTRCEDDEYQNEVKRFKADHELNDSSASLSTEMTDEKALKIHNSIFDFVIENCKKIENCQS